MNANNDPPSDDAQRALEKRALRNVRGLVDRMEATERVERRSQKSILAGIVVLVVVLVVVVSWFVQLSKSPKPANEITVPPPAKSAPK